VTLDGAFARFLNPGREFGPMPFWFWNDDLELDELLRQLHAFHAADFGGFVLHARVGLSRRIGYLTPEYFRLVRAVVAEAARLDMKVILYDEGSYPSGSAHGAVVAENADYASQAIGLWEREVTGPFTGYWRPNTGRALLDRHVCTVLGRVDADGGIDPATVRELPSLQHDVVRIDVPDGHWKTMSVWNTHSGGHVRGVFPEEETGSLSAPPAGDLLNPAAVACFLRLTHDQYYRHLAEYFGSTVIAMFTDEPEVLGRHPIRPADPRPFTAGLTEWLEERWGCDPRTWLPALWLDYGAGTEPFRHRYEEAIHDRLHEVFYAAQSSWCAEHGIALTGHPARSDEMSALRHFQLPGQDMVWRYVEPEAGTAVEGYHSVAAKVATSSARLQGARRVLTEVCGAYGWRLTLEEVKWLYDWHLVRGNNLINPHALFYSIRGRRAWESEPDLFLHNVWQEYVPALNRYAQRVSGLLCDGIHVCEVGILCDGNRVPWLAASQLYRNQIDFLYLDDQAVTTATTDGGLLRAGAQGYRVVVVEGDPPLSEAAGERLAEFERAGGNVIRFEPGTDLLAELDAVLERDLRLQPPHPELRYTHHRRDGVDLYYLVNEGSEEIYGQLHIASAGHAEYWNPLSGQRTVAAASGSSRSVALRLGRRESVVLAVAGGAPPIPVELGASSRGTAPAKRIALDVPWQVSAPNGAPVAATTLGDWAQCAGLELFSGTLCYDADIEVEVEVAAGAGSPTLSLGQVGDIAEVSLDGAAVGVRMWAPYDFRLPDRLAAGPHHLQVRVTNSMANAYEGSQRPSGLMGPVSLTRGSP
jgi:hypothetical protein